MSGILPDMEWCRLRADCTLPNNHQGRCMTTSTIGGFYLREVHGAEKGSVEHAAGVTAAKVYVAEWSDAKAPPPTDSEGGAVSAIADHSTEGISGPPAIPAAAADGDARTVDTAESRQTAQGPTVEAAGAAAPSYDRRQGGFGLSPITESRSGR